ncbi:MAG: hypothetical protein INR66_24365 [Gordonia polyisoprenivorans]|nr:hypothetical protein [Gordonia polyisoprenivorans]
MSESAELFAPWVSFPVAGQPRPVIFLDGRVRIGAGGFTDGDAKVAFLNGAVDAKVPLPHTVLDLLRKDRSTTPPRLVITAVHRVRADFLTDRGPRPLPAYELHTSGTRQPIHVLDPDTEIWWPRTPAASRPGNDGATIDDDDRTVHVLVVGSVLTEFLGCEFDESPFAVIARPITHERLVGPEEAIPAVGVGRTVTGRLTEPLGGRVMLDTRGTPMMVTRTSLPR